MKKIKNFFKFYFMSVGMFTIVCLIVHLLKSTESRTIINLLTAMTVAFIPIQIINLFIFKEGCTKKQLWGRRILAFILNITVIFSSLRIFGILNYDSAADYVRYFITAIVGGMILMTIIFIIADRQEKKLIEKINEKLKENE